MNIKEKIEQLHTNKEFDVFYPKDYTVAVFPNTATMGAAQKALLMAGWTANNIIQFSGAEFLAWHEENNQDKGPLEKLQSTIAELIGQETEYLKDFLMLAQQDHEFLTIYTPTAEDDQHVVETLKPFKPVKLTDYQAGGLVDLDIVQTRPV